jgi:hypothetical protein
MRLLAAFLCGWVFAFLNIFNYLITFLVPVANPWASTVLLALVVPLGLGVAATLTLERGNEHPLSLALGTGLLALTGWYGYWLPGVVRADNEFEASCQSTNPDPGCHHGLIAPGSHYQTTILLYSWLVSGVLVLLSSLVTSLIINFIRKHRRQEVHFP